MCPCTGSDVYRHVMSRHDPTHAEVHGFEDRVCCSCDGVGDGMVLGDGDVTFTAVFDSTVRKYAYTVEYVDGDGNTLADPVCGTADYGSTVDAESRT